jgi:Fur family ferric uptake transcriptional regulator
MRYKTEQRELLHAYFAEHAAEQFTVEELSSALSPAIGKSTVYRLLGELLDSGTVRRFQLGTSRRVYYQYIGGDRCETHLHMKCTECGRICHLAPTLSDFLQKQILATSRFRLDDRLTTLFGKCHTCIRKEKEGST